MSTAPVLEVLRILTAAASGEAAVRVPAYQQLSDLEARPGFVGILLEAYADANAEPQGRLLAVLTCKSVIHRQWQQRSTQGLSPEEKAHAKETLLRLLRVAVDGGLPHLVEFALVLRRVCRFDFPSHWEELTQFFVAELRQLKDRGFDERTISVVLVLHHVLKEQATKQIMSARREFQQLGQALTDPLGTVWSMKLEHLRQQQGSQAASLGDDRMWKLSRYLDGCFLILLAQGSAHLHENPRGPQMIALVREQVSVLLSLPRLCPAVVLRCPYFFKNVKSVLKWWAILLHQHPLAFGQANLGEVLRASAEVLQSYAVPVADVQLRQMAEALLKSSLQMFSHSFNTLAFRKGPQPRHAGLALEAAQLCHEQFLGFVQRLGVGALCSLCCACALQLSAEDAREWLMDPEDSFLGPSATTELHTAGEACVRSLAQEPFDQPLVEYVARRMAEEASQPPSACEPFEVVARRDAVLQLLGICQSCLKPHLQFQQLLQFFVPVAALASQAGPESACLLLPVRLCSVLKAWAADTPAALLPTLLQLLGQFLQEGSPKALRLAALGPLRALQERFSDNEAWSEHQVHLIDGCMVLLGSLRAPDVQWRCLNIIHRFLCEEAETGHYAVTERSLQQLLALWRQQSGGGELVIHHALLDVLRALVLMSSRSRQPRLPLSQPLLSCCLSVVSDCFATHSAASIGHLETRSEVSAALEADAAAAVDRLGKEASATLFDSGCVLFLGVLRTVDAEQAGQLLSFFPQLLTHVCSGPSLLESALDILLEYAALHATSSAEVLAQLRAHYATLLGICSQCLQGNKQDRNRELCLQLLQLLVAYAGEREGISQMAAVLTPILQQWVTTYHQGPPGPAVLPVQGVVGVLCAWHTSHPQHFKQQAAAVAAARGPHALASMLLGCFKSLRAAALRASALGLALSLLDHDAGVDDGFWPDFFQCSAQLLTAAQKKGTSASVLMVQTLQALKSSLATKLPSPTRSLGELQCSMLPPELRQTLQEDGTLDELAVLRWLFGLCARVLQQLAARGAAAHVQLLVAAAPQQVQEALRGAGL